MTTIIFDDCNFPCDAMNEEWENDMLTEISPTGECGSLADDNFDELLMFVDDFDTTNEDRMMSKEIETDDFNFPMTTLDIHPVTPTETVKSTYQGELPPIVSTDMWVDILPKLPDNTDASELRKEYDTTLEKLAASMKRSEATRKQVIHQRKLLGSRHSLNEYAVESRSCIWSFIESHNRLRN